MNDAIKDLCRQNESAILKAMSEVSQVRIAEQIGVSESAISRLKESIAQVAAVMAACNLRVTPRSFKAMDPDRVRALEILARDSLDRADSGWGSL